MNHGKREANQFEGLKAWWEKHQKKVLIALGVLAAISVALAVILTVFVRLPDVPTTSTTATTDTGEEADVPDITTVTSYRREGVYTFLVVGRDTAGGGLTDTMILITYDTVNKTLDALSLPRDTMVNVSTSYKKLNGVYNYNKGSDTDTQVENGITALKEVVEDLTGIYPDFYVIVEWEAVGELVDAIGGVWFDVPYEMDYDDPAQDLHIHQAAGYRLLTGDDAMEVIRHRQNNDGSYSYGDVGRIAVQQDFLIAIAQQCITPSILLKASSLTDIFLQQVTTDLTVGNLLAFAQTLYGMDTENGISIQTMPYTDHYRYTSYVLPVEDELLEILNSGLNPYVEDITSDDLQLLYVVDSAGRMGVTNGELADPSIAEPPVYTSTTTEEETDQEDVTLDEETDQEDATLEEETDGQEEDTFSQPEPVLPDVTTTQEEDQGEDVVLEDEVPTETQEILEEIA